MDEKKDTLLLMKQLKIYFIIGLVLLIGFCLLLFFTISRVQSYVPDMDRHRARDVLFTIDEIAIQRRAGITHLSIQGWSLIPGESIGINNTSILLRNIITGDYLKLSTMMVSRPDVTAEFNEEGLEPEFSYDNSGWHSVVNMNYLSETLDNYEVIILYRGNDNYILVSTDVFLEGM